ncbi:hypothetical protein [Pseudomonas sp. GV071]|uniref:hypothetical protein n=1 Tax=Pseudomonas sp. GV071 TaxID=2135754 RepID=UPI000D390F8B|nr:hypothetical protein [Pseudomonas sp. GV071]PTQ70347.1 hypothetical protein C8K61_10669 [Pseudomonas sp. GV071]
MNFINNYSASISLTLAATSLALALPDGNYRLTIADSVITPTRWEIVDAEVTAGTATLTRGQEGTTAQNWPVDSVIYNALTAGVLTDLFGRGGSPTIVGDDYPASAPPVPGATFIYAASSGAVFIALGANEPEEWVQLRGGKQPDGVSFGDTLNVGRMVRFVEIGGDETEGPSAPLTTLVFPAWQADPYGLEVWIYGAGVGVSVPVDLDFSVFGTTAVGFNVVQPEEGVTFSFAEGVLSVVATQPVRITFDTIELVKDGDTIVGVGGVLSVSGIPETTFYG